MTIYGSTRTLLSEVFGAPDRDRLAGEVSRLWIELDGQVQQTGADALTEPWARAAYRYLLQADGYLADWDLQKGWESVQSAQRAMLTSPNDKDGIVRAAIMLRRE